MFLSMIDGYNWTANTDQRLSTFRRRGCAQATQTHVTRKECKVVLLTIGEG